MRRRRSTSCSSGMSTRNGRIALLVSAAAAICAGSRLTAPAAAEVARRLRRVGDDGVSDMVILLRCVHSVQSDAMRNAAGAVVNLLDHGVADTLGLVGVASGGSAPTCGEHPAAAECPRPRRYDPEEARQQQTDTKVSWCRLMEWRMLKTRATA